MNSGLTSSYLQKRGRRLTGTENSRFSSSNNNVDGNCHVTNSVARWLESLPTNDEWTEIDDLAQAAQRGDFTYSKEKVLEESKDYIKQVTASRKNGTTRNPTKRGKKKKLSCPKKKETNSKIARNKLLLKAVEEIVDDLERDGLAVPSVREPVTIIDERNPPIKSVRSNVCVPARKPRGNLTKRTNSKQGLGMQKPFFQNKELERSLDEVMDKTVKRYRTARSVWKSLKNSNSAMPYDSTKERKRMPFNVD